MLKERAESELLTDTDYLCMLFLGFLLLVALVVLQCISLYFLKSMGVPKLYHPVVL